MFVRNATRFAPVLSRAILLEEVAAFAISLELVFEVRPDGTLALIDEPPRQTTDPPDIRRLLLWRGTSVTAFGHVHGPRQPPFAARARLSLGARHHDVVVFGQRWWERRAGAFAASPAERFDAIPLSWERAFGGTLELAPGYFPGSELPHPGGALAYPFNPRGCGLVIDPEKAVGIPLPNVEDPAHLLAHPLDRPLPAGLAPCAGLPALRRGVAVEEGAAAPLRAQLDHSLHLQHHAAEPMIFDEPVAPGAPVELAGVGAAPLRAQVPASPIHVTVAARGREEVAPPRVRSLHLDGDARRLRVTWGHLLRYDARRPPRFIGVKEAA
jgi:hypothetical protein